MTVRFNKLRPARDVPTLGESIAVRLSILAAISVGLLVIFLGAPYALAHDFFLNNTKNKAGEWCCGAADCGLVDKDAIHARPGGYSVRGNVTYGEGVTGNPADGPTRINPVDEIWPYAQVLPSPDGRAWRCHRSDGSPRCMFTGPPGS